MDKTIIKFARGKLKMVKQQNSYQRYGILIMQSDCYPAVAA